MAEDLDLAAKVHYSFLPKDYEDDRARVAVTLRPLFKIGGDYCSILPLKKNRLLVCTCDAVGHGIAAALFAARVNTYVLNHAHVDPSPCNLVPGLNAYLCQRLGGVGMYASFYALLFDFEAGDLTLTGAAHPPVLECFPGKNQCRRWPSDLTYLGITDPMPIACTSKQVSLQQCQRFLLYSDGLVEVEDRNQNLFGLERLCDTFVGNGNLTCQELNSAVLKSAENFANGGFQDDVLLMSIAIK